MWLGELELVYCMVGFFCVLMKVLIWIVDRLSGNFVVKFWRLIFSFL